METTGQRARVKWGLNRAARAPNLPCGGLLLTLDAVRRAGVGGGSWGPSLSLRHDTECRRDGIPAGVSSVSSLVSAASRFAFNSAKGVCLPAKWAGAT